MSIIDVISDYSNQKLEKVPENVLGMYNLKMLYLEGNLLESLPDDFFAKLSKLTWLDLRRNKLKTLPEGVAHHSFLETLLLQNNHFEQLQNEIGLIPNLKVLQLSGNPLKYPAPEVLEKGSYSICCYLKQEYYKQKENTISEDEEEREISITEPKSSSQLSKITEKVPIKELLRRSAKKLRTYGFCMPVIDVKSLSKVNPEKQDNIGVKNASFNSIRPSSSRKTHKITRGCSKISLSSQSQWNSKKRNEERAQEKELKDVWLSRLRDLLTDQEKILQQERNLTAVSKWRLEKKAAGPRASAEKPCEAPFALDPEFNRMLSRKDLTRQIDQMINKNKRQLKRTQSAKNADIQKLIDQVVDQMRAMESRLTTVQSPRAEQEIAAKQIESIVELHKKIIKLQTTNDSV